MQKVFSKIKIPALYVVAGIVSVLVVLALILCNLVLLDYYMKTVASEKSVYEQDKYHIVYMNNNLFYFCKLESYNSEYVECKDPYYLVRKKEENNDGVEEDKIYVRRPAEEEIYNPEGSIYLKKDNIVYLAKLSDDSVVLEYIKNESK
ncbi:hypothetical protein JW710_00555 [Candidatus Dojkabacteria bacterium]|nr:hypothetical protein [Candidatus Dojkabacteria bacterium]